MTYKETIKWEMTQIAHNSNVRFIGYNTQLGHQMYGTLSKCGNKCIETPVAENLMVGLAMGLSLEGFRPVVCFERSGFLLPALDGIINHMWAFQRMCDEVKFPVILRVIIPTDKPLDPGIQHLGDYTKIIKQYTGIPVVQYEKGVYIESVRNHSNICIVERKEWYDQNYSSISRKLHSGVSHFPL